MAARQCPNSVIVIQGNRITAVGRAGQVQVPAGAQVINAAGKWITPGLIDAKANWNWMYGEGFLHWGVTSAMVTGARNDQGIAERDAVNHGIYPGPRLYQGFLNLQGGGPDGKRRNAYKPGDGDRIARTPEEGARWLRYLTSNRAPISSAPMTAMRRRKFSPLMPMKRIRPARALSCAASDRRRAERNACSPVPMS